MQIVVIHVYKLINKIINKKLNNKESIKLNKKDKN